MAELWEAAEYGYKVRELRSLIRFHAKQDLESGDPRRRKEIARLQALVERVGW